MCRNDKKLLKYELEVDLYGDVQPFEVEESVMEEFNNAVAMYDSDYSQYLVDNKTYTELKKEYDTDLKHYKAKVKEQKIIAKNSYGDETEKEELVEPTRP